jgi:hypothetical protein
VTTQQTKPADLATIARGALMELFTIEAARVAANIADVQTVATAPREIILRLKIKPNSDRVGLDIESTASSKMASVAKHSSTAYIAKDKAGKAYIVTEDQRQQMLFEPPAKAEVFDMPQANQA